MSYELLFVLVKVCAFF